MSPEEKDRKIERLEQENQALRERIAELERYLGLNSETSSKPPSSDGLKKKSKNRTKSLREKGLRPSGGQLGHQGQTLEQVLQPDTIIEHTTPCLCHGCGCDVSQISVERIIKRQVFDIPAPQIIVTEHQVGVKQCPQCQSTIQGRFPESVKAPVQYGVRIKAVATYLHHQHFIPEDRLSEVFQDIFGCKITPGTIANTTKLLAQIIEPVVTKIEKSVKESPVKHLDETGFRIGGKTQWLHVVSTEQLSWYRVSNKRKDIEILSELKGTVVHDHWKPYYQLNSVNHALCNAHHLRELTALEEIELESWAKSMKKLLLLACHYKNRYQSGIPENIVARLNQLYEQILKRGLDFHQLQPPLARKGNRGRQKRRVGHNLLVRFQNFKIDVLRFLTDTNVPFTNNQAERDLRMMKCKQKISGGFRSFSNAVSFANIRSFLSTASKQGFNLLSVLIDALQGNISIFFAS